MWSSLEMFDLATGDLRISLGIDEVWRLEFSPDGSVLAAARNTKCKSDRYVDL